MSNFYNTLAWARAVRARKRLRKSYKISKKKRRSTVPVAPREDPPKPPPMTQQAKSFKGALASTRKRLEQQKTKADRAERMRRLNELRRTSAASASVASYISTSAPTRATSTPIASSTNAPISTATHVTNSRGARRPRTYFSRPKSDKTLRRRILQFASRHGRHLRAQVSLALSRVRPVKKKGPPILNLLQSLKLLVRYQMTNRKYRELAQLRVVVPERQKEAARRKLFAESGYEEIMDPFGVAYGWWRSLRRTVFDLLAVADVDNLPKPVRIVIALDGGGSKVKSTKVVLHLADGPKPTSAHKCGVYAVVIGDEDYDTLGPIICRLNRELNDLKKDGLDVKGKHYDLKFFLVADLKGTGTLLGLQGGSATYPCPFCLMQKGKYMNDPNSTSKARTIGHICQCFANFANLSRLRPPGYKEALCKRENYSVADAPLLTAIEIECVAPPVLHVTMGVVNSIVEAMKRKSPTRVDQLLKSAHVTLVKGRFSDLTGVDGVRLVNYVCGLPVAARQDPYLLAFVAAKPLFRMAQIDADYSRVADIIKNVMVHMRAIRSIATKMHVLEHHVVPFIETHQTWGRISEQGVESIHKWVNVAVRRMPGQPPVDRIACFLKDHLIRNLPDPDEE